MYEMGMGVALLLWLYSVIMYIVNANSLMARNLRKIGKRISLTGNTVDIIYPESSKMVTVLKFFMVYFVFGLPLIVFSWVYVALIGGGILYAWQKNLGEPKEIKEYRWRMKNVDMSFDEIIRALMKAEGLPNSDFMKVRQEWIEYINLRKNVA